MWRGGATVWVMPRLVPHPSDMPKVWREHHIQITKCVTFGLLCHTTTIDPYDEKKLAKSVCVLGWVPRGSPRVAHAPSLGLSFPTSGVGARGPSCGHL